MYLDQFLAKNEPYVASQTPEKQEKREESNSE